jgi:hypothetical protein
MARRYEGPLIFLLDEMDALLIGQRKDASLLNALRAASNSGDCRIVLAGFREVMQAASNLDSPLYNFARSIRLKEFTRDQTADMILGPLVRLGVHFEQRNEVVDRIYHETAGQPNLIQFYCSILVEELDRRGSRTISPDSLFDVYGNADLRAFLTSTFMDNTTHLEKALVFAILSTDETDPDFDLALIDRALQDNDIEVPLSDLDQACHNLELAGVLTAQGRHYHFATPVFPRVLRENYDVGYLFRKVLREGIS